MSAIVRTLIDRLAQSAGEDGKAQIARRFDALPIYEDLGGWALLTTEGEVLELGEDGRTTPVRDPMKTVCLVAGSEKYPELKALLPVRPAASVDCTDCNGTGRAIVNGKSFGFRCGACRALGWVET